MSQDTNAGCPAHRALGLALDHFLLPGATQEAYFQVRWHAQGVQDSQWGPPQYKWDELRECYREGGSTQACGWARVQWESGVSFHAAPYRTGSHHSAPYPRVILWSDADQWNDRLDAGSFPFWPSRVLDNDDQRGVVLYPWTIMNGPEQCTFRCAWGHFNRLTGGDPSAAHSKHSFRLPGISAVKNYGETSEETMTKLCFQFIEQWESFVPFNFHVVETPRKARWEPKPGMTGMLHPAMIDLARRAWIKGKRHEAAMGYAGVIRHAGFPEEVAIKLVWEMCAEQDDIEVQDRLSVVKSTYNIPLSRVAGISLLRTLVL